MTETEIVGASMTRFGQFTRASVRSLAQDAVASALADARLTAADVDIVFFSNASSGSLTDQENIRGQVALRYTGLLGLPIVNVENACASGSTAFSLAVSAVMSGTAEVAIAVGSEKMTGPEKAKTFAASDSAVDVEEFYQAKEWFRAGEAWLSGRDEIAASIFTGAYAAQTRRYMVESGATRDDFAQVTVKNRAHAVLNENAQYRAPVTKEQVLTSRLIDPPLTMLMRCPVGDGAAALVVCTRDRARSLGVPAVHVLSSVLVSGRSRREDDPTSAMRAARLAYERSGVGPEDVNVLEVHDATASAEVMIYEELGLCRPGEGPALLRSGATTLGGRVVVNPSGGLLSKGHPIGATGCAQIVELADQLRGRCGPRQVDGAHVAVAENAGGLLENDAAATAVTVLAT